MRWGKMRAAKNQQEEDWKAAVQEVSYSFEIDNLLEVCLMRFHYQRSSSSSSSLAGTSMTRGLSMMRALRSPFSTMPTIQAA